MLFSRFTSSCIIFLSTSKRRAWAWDFFPNKRESHFTRISIKPGPIIVSRMFVPKITATSFFEPSWLTTAPMCEIIKLPDHTFWAAAPKGTMSCRAQGTFVRLFNLFVNFSCYSMGILHFFIFHQFSILFNGNSIFASFLVNFPCYLMEAFTYSYYSMGIQYFSIICQFPMLFNWNSTFSYFLVNFPWCSMGITHIFIFFQFSM